MNMCLVYLNCALHSLSCITFAINLYMLVCKCLLELKVG
jgi:hypothetical protein